MYLYVLYILEHVFAVALKAVYTYVVAEHEGISAAVQLQVLHVDAVAAPENLVGVIYLNVLDVDVVHLAEHLRRVYHGVLHRQMV